MAKFKKFKINRDVKIERLYILEIWLDGNDFPIYKIGKSSGKSSKQRMLSIIGSYYDAYRVTPIIKIKRDREVTDVFTKETMLHKYYKKVQYKSKKRFSGNTELFHIEDVEGLYDVYNRVIKGEDVNG